MPSICIIHFLFIKQFGKRKSACRELCFHGDTRKHEIRFVLFKVKHNDSQYCCAISYLHWIVISIGCSARLEVLEVGGLKEKIEEN